MVMVLACFLRFVVMLRRCRWTRLVHPVEESRGAGYLHCTARRSRSAKAPRRLVLGGLGPAPGRPTSHKLHAARMIPWWACSMLLAPCRRAPRLQRVGGAAARRFALMPGAAARCGGPILLVRCRSIDPGNTLTDSGAGRTIPSVWIASAMPCAVVLSPSFSSREPCSRPSTSGPSFRPPVRPATFSRQPTIPRLPAPIPLTTKRGAPMIVSTA